MICANVCWHPQHQPLSLTCLMHSTRNATEHQHGRTCHLAVLFFVTFEALPSRLWFRAHPFFSEAGPCRVTPHFCQRVDRCYCEYNIQTNIPFCSTPLLRYENGSWRFGACQCCRCVLDAVTHVRRRSPDHVLLFALRLTFVWGLGGSVAYRQRANTVRRSELNTNLCLRSSASFHPVRRALEIR